LRLVIVDVTEKSVTKTCVEAVMKLSAPTTIVFLISLVIAIIGLLGRYAGISMPLENFHIMLVAWIVLSAGCLMKGI